MSTRIYYPHISFDAPLSEAITLVDNPAHHLIHVLRKKISDSVILFDGKNNEYHTAIKDISKKRITLILENKLHINRESPLIIHLIQAISKGDRMDWVVQKAIELGVSSITPITTQHGAVKLDKDRMKKKIDHWQNIAISACEQSGRNVVPVINEMIRFDDFLDKDRNDSTEVSERIKWILHTNMGVSEHKSATSTHQKVRISHASILIGPEGGFSENEVSHATQSNYQPITLGPRIFRTETAALATISVLQTQFGDWFHG